MAVYTLKPRMINAWQLVALNVNFYSAFEKERAWEHKVPGWWILQILVSSSDSNQFNLNWSGNIQVEQSVTFWISCIICYEHFSISGFFNLCFRSIWRIVKHMIWKL